MTPFWWTALIVWLAALIYATPGAWAAAFKNSQRRGDPMRLAVWLVSAIMVFGNGRWLFAPLSETLWKAILVVAILTAIYVVFLMRSYGRGALIDDSDISDARDYDDR